MTLNGHAYGEHGTTGSSRLVDTTTGEVLARDDQDARDSWPSDDDRSAVAADEEYLRLRGVDDGLRLSTGCRVDEPDPPTGDRVDPLRGAQVVTVLAPLSLAVRGTNPQRRVDVAPGSRLELTEVYASNGGRFLEIVTGPDGQWLSGQARSVHRGQ